MPWWDDDTDPNADMWATVEEARDQVLALYGRACAHADRTIDELELDTVGQVAWRPGDRQSPTLHTLLVAVIAEANRHAGHADILRELIDGRDGLRAGRANIPPATPSGGAPTTSTWTTLPPCSTDTRRRATRLDGRRSGLATTAVELLKDLTHQRPWSDGRSRPHRGYLLR